MSFFSIKSDGGKHHSFRISGASGFRAQSQPAASFFPSARYDFFGQSSTHKFIAQVLLTFGLMLLLSTLSFQWWQHDAHIAEENALLELSQGVLLLCASTMLAARAWLVRGSKSLNGVIFLTLSFFFLAMFLREVDIDKLGRSPMWVVVERVIRSITVLAVGAFMLSLLPKMKLLLTNFFAMLQTPAMLITILGCFLYACGWFFDKEMFPITKSLSRCIEEIIELNACLVFTLAAFARGVPPRANKAI